MDNATSTLTLRISTQEDFDFLYNLLKITMQDYVARIWGWDEGWQLDYFRQDFEPGRDQIVVLNGQDIGVIATEKSDAEILLEKVYILPGYQGQGIGTHLVGRVLDEGHAAGLPVTLRVLKGNPARRLYERLGFVVVEETTTTHDVMRAIPDRTIARDG